jgi:multidrug efflux pump subunit AcrA (membrane-fusion protein)
VVTSPTDGQLGRLNLTIGQNVSSGGAIGELKIMNNYKVRTQLSEYYVERINAGLPAMILQKKDTIPMRISRVMPEVKDRMFEADLVFLGHTPDNIRLGKSYRVKIELGQPESALIIPRGDFYQHTGGKWIFRIDPETGTARRTEIEIGRQNPEQFEILSGLAPGDSVILSGYERFLQAEQIKIEK